MTAQEASLAPRAAGEKYFAQQGVKRPTARANETFRTASIDGREVT
jgi:hypothetical protein